MDTVECRVDKVVFRSAENGFSILSCITDHDYITITGPMADVQPGVTLTVQGAVSYTHLDVYKRQGMGVSSYTWLG